jgi:GR25 family glycosyltransferase involved in LPS biosynthesis
MDSYGINFSFWEAADGSQFKDLDGNEIKKETYLKTPTPFSYNNKVYNYIPHNIGPVNNKKMNRGQIGCGLSHLLLQENMIFDTEKYYLIFEDDFIFEDYFNKELFLKALNSLPEDFDICFFSTLHAHKVMLPVKEMINEFVYTVPPFPSFSGSAAYLISKECAKKFLSYNGTNVTFVTDDMFSFYSIINQIKVYSTYIKFGDGNKNIFSSTIGYGTDESHINSIGDLNNA